MLAQNKKYCAKPNVDNSRCRNQISIADEGCWRHVGQRDVQSSTLRLKEIQDAQIATKNAAEARKKILAAYYRQKEAESKTQQATKELYNLKSHYATLLSRNKKYLERKRQLENDYEFAKSELQQARFAIVHAKEALQNMTQKYQKEHEVHQRYEEDKQRYTKAYRTMKRQLLETQNREKQAIEKVTRWAANIVSLQTQLEQTRKELQNIKSGNNDLKVNLLVHQSKKIKKDSKSNSKTEIIEQLRNKLANEDLRLEELHEQITKMEEKEKTTQKEVQLNEQKIKTLEDELQKKPQTSKDQEDLEQELKNVRNAYQIKVDELNVQKKSMNDLQTQIAQTEKDKKSRKSNSKTETIAQLHDQLAQQEQHIQKESERQKAVSKNRKRRLKNLTDQISKMEEKETTAQEEVRKNVLKIQELENKLNQKPKELKNQTDLKTELEEVKKDHASKVMQLHSQEQTITDLRQKLAKTETDLIQTVEEERKQNMAITISHATNEKLNTELKALEAKYATESGKSKQYETEIARLTKEVNDNKETYKRTMKELEEKQKVDKSQATAVQNISQPNADQTKQIQELEAKFEQQSQEYATLLEQYNDALSELESVSTEKYKCSDAIEKFKKKKKLKWQAKETMFNQHIEECKKVQEEQKETISRLKQTTENKEQNEAKWQKKEEELTRQLAKFENDKEVQIQKMRTLKQTIKNLNQEIETANEHKAMTETELEEANEQLTKMQAEHTQAIQEKDKAIAVLKIAQTNLKKTIEIFQKTISELTANSEMKITQLKHENEGYKGAIQSKNEQLKEENEKIQTMAKDLKDYETTYKSLLEEKTEQDKIIEDKKKQDKIMEELMNLLESELEKENELKAIITTQEEQLKLCQEKIGPVLNQNTDQTKQLIECNQAFIEMQQIEQKIEHMKALTTKMQVHETKLPFEVQTKLNTLTSQVNDFQIKFLQTPCTEKNSQKTTQILRDRKNQLLALSQQNDSNYTSLNSTYEEFLNAPVRAYVRLNISSKDNESLIDIKESVDKNEITLTNNQRNAKTYSKFFSIYGAKSTNETMYRREDSKTPPLKGVFNLLQSGWSNFLFGYGFSGSGKTYTLFGDAKTNVSGVVQLGLDDLPSNSTKELVAVFELYGKKKFLYDKKGSLKIEQEEQIIVYSGNIVNSVGSDDYLQLPNRQKITSQSLVNETNVLTGVAKGNDVNVNQIITILQAHRLKCGRERQTPNNPSSSRGHLFLVFKVVNNNVASYLTVIDMAGVENPKDIANQYFGVTNTKEMYNVFTKIPTMNTITQEEIKGNKTIVIRDHKLTGSPWATFINDHKTKEAIDVADILQEGFYINETINALRYFLKSTTIANLKQRNENILFGNKQLTTLKEKTKIINTNTLWLEKYDPSQFFDDPKEEFFGGKLAKPKHKIISIFKTLSALSSAQKSQFLMLALVKLNVKSNETSEKVTEQAGSVLDFAESFITQPPPSTPTSAQPQMTIHV